ncbi:MAG: MFS transporter [Myxococcales bacterium]|nr:MFS transporter [Myxococcales bacterium]
MPRLREKLEAVRRLAKSEGKFLLATFAASGVGYLGSSAAPVIVQALIEAGVRHQEAGDLGTIELSTVALSTLLMTPLVPYVSHRKLALGGACVALVGLLVSALSSEYTAMMIGRLVIGSGSGMAISGANAAVAAREDAERIFAIIWTMGGGITAGLTKFLPHVVAGGNYAMGFATLLVLTLVAMPLLAWLPPRPRFAHAGSAASPESAQSAASAAPDRVPVEPSRSFGWMAFGVLAAVFIYSVTEQALWQFSIEIAVSRGFDEDVASSIIASTVIMGLVGGAIAAWLGQRLGRVFPIVVGSLCSLAGRWAYISAATPETLWMGGLIWGLGFYFVSPYQIGLAAAIDRRGRVAVATASVTNLGYGLGPGICGRIRQYQIDHGLDYSLLIAVIVGGTLLSLLLLLPVALRVDRASRAQHTA